MATLSGLARIARDDIVPLLQEYCYEDYHMRAEILGKDWWLRRSLWNAPVNVGHSCSTELKRLRHARRLGIAWAITGVTPSPNSVYPLGFRPRWSVL